MAYVLVSFAESILDYVASPYSKDKGNLKGQIGYGVFSLLHIGLGLAAFFGLESSDTQESEEGRLLFDEDGKTY